MSSGDLHFDIECLEPLDVILVRGDGITGGAIRALDRGEFSHAILHKMNGVCIEAVLPTVTNIDLSRFKAKSIDSVRVLRNLRLTRQGKESVARSIDGKFGARYSLLPLMQGPKESYSGFFCSMLVAYGYELAGVPKINGSTFNKVSPSDIARDPAFSDLSESVLIPENRSSMILRDYIEHRDITNFSTRAQSDAYSRAYKVIKGDYQKLTRKISGTTSQESSIVAIIFTLELMVRKDPRRGLRRWIEDIDEKIRQSFEKDRLIEVLVTAQKSELTVMRDTISRFGLGDLSIYAVKSRREIDDLDSIETSWGDVLKLKSAMILRAMRNDLHAYHTERISIIDSADQGR